MAHEIQTMAFVNETPWHGLGHQLTPQQAIDVWQREAGMDWRIKETDVLYSVSGGDGVHLKAKRPTQSEDQAGRIGPTQTVSEGCATFSVYRAHKVAKHSWAFVFDTKGREEAWIRRW